MNTVHYLARHAVAVVARLRGVLRLLFGTLLLAALCVLLADPQAPGRWFGELVSSRGVHPPLGSSL